MRTFPEPIQQLSSALTRLPGVGPKTALRYVFALLKQPREEVRGLSQLILELSERVKTCGECYGYTDNGVCALCQDASRDGSVLCVVETSRDISTIESTGAFRGRFFVLGGTLNPIEGATPETLNLRPLVARLETDTRVNEIILAFSPDVHGETTMMYLTKQLKPFNRRVTKLARGLPTGASLEFADEVTLGDALKGRREA